ncbi:MAG: ABC transporter permease [Bacteroidetes bacterium]|nr:ABC transporter permease [Bacteroidota bacterium]
MLKNYFTILVRGFRKTPLFTFLNIAGLALGIACAALIFLWAEYELGFDHQYAKRNQLYSIEMNIDYSNRIDTYYSIPGPMGDAARTDIPEIVNMTRLGFGHELFAVQDKANYEHGFYVDTGFFSMYQPEFIRGNAAGFNNPHTLVLSEKMARKFFATTDVVGKSLRVDNQEDYTVLGVVKDPPPNVSVGFDWLAPVSNFYDKNRWLRSWGTYGIITQVELRPDANTTKVSTQLTTMLRSKAPLYAHADCFLWPMEKWHLYDHFTNGKPDGGLITFIRLFSTIAWIILFIACINFMNLATARATQRAREVGVRKTLGAMRKALVAQFILESILKSFVAVIMAVGLVYLALPAFNTLLDRQLPFTPLAPEHLAALVGIGLLCGLIAGTYPAFYLSSFNPVAVLKGQQISMNNGAGYIRKGLVVTQFTVSVTLIVCTAIIYRQVQHIRSRDLGYDKEHLLNTSLQGKMAEHFNAIRSGLLQTGVVADAAISSSPALQMWMTVTTKEMTWAGADPNKDVKMCWENVSPEYFSTMGLRLSEGRAFYPDIKADSGDIVVNETMARMISTKSCVGQYVTYGHERYRIVGIVKDYLFNDMYASVSPLILYCSPETSRNYGFLEIRLKPGDLPATLSKVEAVIKANNPGYPFDYQFADEQFERLFTLEARVGEFAGIFSMLTIFISCLGLFGLAAYTAERKTKEIGIRKVLGASTTRLAGLLSKEFLQLVALSCAIAFPLAWGFMHHWLKDYAYRTAMHWWIFALAGLAAMLIALLTVSVLAIRAALANPVNSLRSE